MSATFSHTPVLPEETLELLAPERGGIFVDGTLGGGGHAEAVLNRLPKTGRLIGIDRDWEAVHAAGDRLSAFGDRFTALHGNFFDMRELLESIGVTSVNGILLDLGVSSHQLDTQARGFSYKNEAPLDMRMDQSAALTARDVVNGYAEEELARVLWEYGEERFSRRIAERICRAREQYPIETTLQLAGIVREAIPAKYRNEPQHPARRTFQALRIEVNGELKGLDRAVESACDLLQKGGRLCIITFHSLEDRIVKQAFRRFEKPCTCPPSAPVCICGKEPKAKILTRKPLTASQEEEARNSRSTSAKLRCIEKI
ncbi:MAG: 16S rRNA (cytosine(1402)-N(4))-methyltransferase RsmH [Clostridiales bacterium]|nr:16S rRNA (cytosine(1402)-N(4))-methyltransferase RsmH [Clostridiales bacterium]